MTDIWGFLLQTLTASGVAVLLILIKVLFKDKLPPKWHFAVWGVLGVIILFPAGLFGRYTLFNWQVVIEVIKGIAGEYGFSKVLFPVPIITSKPETVAEWVFALYTIGVVISLLNYGVSYIRLRAALLRGRPASDEITERVKGIAAEIKVKPCRVIAVSGLSGAFVCGIIRPVFVVPSDAEIDDKVLLHELFHLKNCDTLWSVVICILRCLHWCNPLIVYCANKAINDMESRCDQYVLEHLEGEERREYGHILLSMVNERFAKTPGTTCVNNGGKNIKERIEAIARFKRYPVGMGLVSMCVLAVMSLSLVIGVQASYRENPSYPTWLTVASARSTYCTTYAGAFDAYAKAVLTENGFYRIMCAPVLEQKMIIEEVRENERKGIFPNWNSGLDEMPYASEGYYIYNLEEICENIYEGLLVVRVSYIPEVIPDVDKKYLAVQSLRVERENTRWVALPIDDFRLVETLYDDFGWGCDELPGIRYTGVADDFEIDVTLQTIRTMDSKVQDASDINFLFSGTFYDTVPRPNSEFTKGAVNESCGVMHLGTEEEREGITSVGISVAAVYPGDETMPQPEPLGGLGSVHNSNSSKIWGSEKTEPGWGPYISFICGGYGTNLPERDIVFPEFYVADLYVNGEVVKRVDLYPEGGAAK